MSSAWHLLRRIGPVITALAFILVAAPFLAQTEIETRLRLRVEAGLSTESFDVMDERVHARTTLRRLYPQRNFEPVWVTDDGLAPHAEAFVDWLVTGPLRQGLNSSHYHLDAIESLELDRMGALVDVERGYIELTPALVDLEVSPHFTLGQFPSKQTNTYPKYLVLRESLLLKLELLLERLNEVGVEADSFTVMSGFRTPIYNRAIGNGRHSRHIYGGAADIYVDVSPRDDIMDDLNKDGALDYRDAQWLYRLADELFGRPEHTDFRGGLGVYRTTAAHGPFLHVGARGRRARWGLLP